MNLQRRKFLRQFQRGSCAALLAYPAIALISSLHMPAYAGNQAEEDLSDSVRTALSQAIRQSAPPKPVLRTTLERQEFETWLHHASQRLKQWMIHPDDRQEFLNCHCRWYWA
jgi:hypothetical protein